MRRMFREGQHLPSERIEGLYVRCPTPSRIDLKLSLLACLMEEAERKGPIAGHVDALGEQEPTRGLPIDAEGWGVSHLLHTRRPSQLRAFLDKLGDVEGEVLDRLID